MTICVLIVTLSLHSFGYELGLKSILRLDRLDRVGETGKGDLIQVKSATSGDSSLTNVEQKLGNALSNLMTDRCLFYVFYYLLKFGTLSKIIHDVEQASQIHLFIALLIDSKHL